MAGGLTIGQAAAFAGVTIKTVRHYHRLGLVDEPRRDASGYRRYASTDLLRLVQVRALAEAGVPLAEIGTLLDSDPQRFAATLTDVERRLTDRIEELVARRDTLQRLADGDRALLPDRACAILDRLTELGFQPDYTASQREGLILARALAPELFDGLVTQLEHRLEDPEYVELTKRSWDALSWELDDPRLDELRICSRRQPADQPRTDGGASRLLLHTRRHHPLRAGQQPPGGPDADPGSLTALIEAKLRAAGLDIPGS